MVPKPAALTFEQAAAVPMAGAAALRGIRDAGAVRAGHRVLVNGAAGGVGTYAIQIAAALGAEVTGVCSTRSAGLVRSIGAAHVVDYTREDFTDGLNGGGSPGYLFGPVAGILRAVVVNGLADPGRRRQESSPRSAPVARTGGRWGSRRSAPSACSAASSGGLAAEIERLRAEPAEGDMAIGGATVAAETAALGLIDEYRARVYPVLAGGGIPFFAQRERRVDPGLAETRTFSSRVVYLRYRVAR